MYYRPNLGTWRIYRIFCDKTNMSYIGQTWTFINIRFQEHIEEAMNGSNKSLHQAINNYGIENFYIQLLKDGIHSQEEADYWERYYIKQYDSFKHGYNMTIGGQDGIYVLDEDDMKIVRYLYFRGENTYNIAKQMNVYPRDVINSLKRENNFYGYEINPLVLQNPPWCIDVNYYDQIPWIINR